MIDRRAAGRKGEAAAADYLEKQGYSVLHRNFRYGKYGEIDIVANKGGTLCFIEVKMRTDTRYGTPAEAVGYRKRVKIINVANHYMKVSGNKGQKLRFDVIEIYASKYDPAGDCLIVDEIRHIENAFGSA